jgi:divalent metal cation (Fe/Co/Zn/Cd) transporter
VWTVVSAGLALVVGIGHHSLVLVAFALTGLLDAAGSLILVVHLTSALRADQVHARAEHLASRVIALALAAVGLSAIAESARRLAVGAHAAATRLGIGVACASLVAFSLLAWRKRVLAARIGSRALRGDSHLSAMGAGLAGVTVTGTVATAALGWQWLDPAAALGAGAAALAIAWTFARDVARVELRPSGR